MAGPKALPLATQANPSEHGLDQAEILENGYVEPRKTDAGAVMQILACPGLASFATLADGGGIRAMHSLDSEMLVVTGRTVRRVDAGGTETIVGGLPSDGFVSTAQNRRAPNNEVAIVCDGLMKIYQNGVLTQVDDPDLVPPNSVAFHGGLTLTTSADGRGQASEINSAGEYDALDFEYFHKSPDGLYRVVSRGADTAWFGPKSIEFWVQYAPDVGFPFQFSTSINQGLLAPGGLVETAWITPTGAHSAFVFPATSHEGKYTGICVLDGYSLRKISTAAVDRDIENELFPLTLQATSWTQGGHGFYCISGTSFSWQFDTFTGKWVKRSSYLSDRWRVGLVAALGQRLIAGHHSQGTLYSMSRDALSEGSDPLIWTVQTPRSHAFPGPVEYNALYVDAIPGVGLNDGVTQNVTPHLMMQWTEDGETWSTERWRSLGIQGAGRQDVRWNGLGTSRGRGRIYRLRASAAVVRGIRGASVDAVAIAA